MKKIDFAKRLILIFEDRNIKEPSEVWLDFLYSQIQNFKDEDMCRGFSKILSIEQAEWNKTFGFGGKPAVADFLKFFGADIRKELSEEDLATIEIDKILFESRHSYSSWTPKNETTKKVLNSFPGGLKTIHYDLFDSWNDYKKHQGYYRKDLIEKWLLYNKSSVEFHRLENNNIKLLPKFQKN